MSSEGKVVWLAGFSHFITHGYMTLLPAVLIVIAGEQSISFTDIGIIATFGYFLYGLGAFPAGYLADKYGSKRVLTAGVLGMALSSLLVGISSGTILFALSYALLGVFASIHHPAGLSLIARRVEKKGKAMGLHGVLGNVGLIISPLTASASVKYFDSWRAAYIVFGFLGLILFWLMYISRIEQEQDLSFTEMLTRKINTIPSLDKTALHERSQQVEQPDSNGLPEPAVFPIVLLFLLVGCVLSGFIFRGSLTYFPMLFQQYVTFINQADQPVVLAGYVTTAVLSLGLIGAWIGGYINDKIKCPEIIPVIIFVIIAPTLYCIGRFSDSKLLAISCLFSLVYYAWQPSQNFLIAKYTKKASHGMGFGINFFLLFGVGSIATAIGGYVADAYGVDRFYEAMSWDACLALLVALAVLFARPYAFKYTWKLIRA
jgi:MFS family permease